MPSPHLEGKPSCQADALETLFTKRQIFLLSDKWGSTATPSCAPPQCSRQSGAAEGAGAKLKPPSATSAVAGERTSPGTGGAGSRVAALCSTDRATPQESHYT